MSQSWYAYENWENEPENYSAVAWFTAEISGWSWATDSL